MTSKNKHSVWGWLLLTFCFAYGVEAMIIARGGIGQVSFFWNFLLMWTPGISTFIWRSFHPEFRTLNFFEKWLPKDARAFPKLPLLIPALFLPALVALIAYPLAWKCGLAELSFPYDRIQTKTGLTGNAAVLFFVFGNFTVGIAICFFAALGEELGWRGFLLPTLLARNERFPILKQTLVWAAFHFPIILWGGYATSGRPLLSLIIFTLALLPEGWIIAQLRIRSKSLWPCVVYHAAWNTTIQAIFDRLTRGDQKDYWVGESGILVMGASVVVSVFFYFGLKKCYPDDLIQVL